MPWNYTIVFPKSIKNDGYLDFQKTRIMRYLLRISFFIFAIAMSSQAFGQNLLSKANKQYELKAYIYAIPNYLAIIQKDSDEPQALSNLADSYRMLNKMDEAEKWYSKAVKYAGIDPIHFLYYGKVLMVEIIGQLILIIFR